MTGEEWRRAHPFIGPVARLHDQVESALTVVTAPEPPKIPTWEDYFQDYGDGVSLLQSPAAAIDLEPSAATTVDLVARLSDGPSREPLVRMTADLRDELERDPAPLRRIADCLLGEPGSWASAGLLRWLGWTAARRHLQPLLQAFAAWRTEDRWQRSHCPACGAAPAMAQLVGVDPGFMRFLSCGCCGMRWRWRRTACPFCENDPHSIEVVTIKAEPLLRIDHCESCRGYLKTYVGNGDEGVLLADWTSPHLDVIARDRGFERRAASLYDLTGLLETPS